MDGGCKTDRLTFLRVRGGVFLGGAKGLLQSVVGGGGVVCWVGGASSHVICQVIGHVTGVFYSLVCRFCLMSSTRPFTPSICPTPPALALPTEHCTVTHTRLEHDQKRCSPTHQPGSGWVGVQLLLSCYVCPSGVSAESGRSFTDVVKDGLEPRLVVTPDPRAQEVYIHTHTHTRTELTSTTESESSLLVTCGAQSS